MKDRVLQMAYLLVPFGFLSVGVLHIGHKYAFLITALVVLAFQIKNLFLRGFLVYASAWTLFLLIKAVSDPAYVHPAGMSFGMIWFFTASAILYLAVIKSNLKKESYYNLICIGAIIQATLALFQLCGFDPVLYLLSQNIGVSHKLPEKAIIGTLGNNNFLAAYLAISLPFFFRIRKPYYKLSWCWFIPIITFLLFISGSSAAVIPAIIGTMIFFNKWWIWASGLVAGIGFGYYDGTIKLIISGKSPRFGFWMETIRQFDSPAKIIFGFGSGASWGKSHPLHNEWLTILYQYGLIGLSLITGFAMTIHRGNRMLFSAFVIACVNMLGNYPLHLAPSVFLIIIIMALIQREVCHA